MRQTLGAIGAAFLLVAALVAGTTVLGDPSKPGCGLSTPGSCDVRTLYRAVESVPVTDDYEARALMLLALGQIRTVDNQAIANINKVYQSANADTAPCIRAVLLETIDENYSVFTTVGSAGKSWDQAVAAASSSDFIEARRNYLSVARSKIGGSTDVLLDGSYAARINNMKKCSLMRNTPVHVASAPTSGRQLTAVPRPVHATKAPIAGKTLDIAPPAKSETAPRAPLASPEKPQISQKAPVAAPAQSKVTEPARRPALPSRSEPEVPGPIFIQPMPDTPSTAGGNQWFAADAPLRLDNNTPSPSKSTGTPKAKAKANGQKKDPKTTPATAKPKKTPVVKKPKKPKKSQEAKKPPVTKVKKTPAPKKPKVAKDKPNPGKSDAKKAAAPPKKSAPSQGAPPQTKNTQEAPKSKPKPKTKKTPPGQEKKQTGNAKGKKK